MTPSFNRYQYLWKWLHGYKRILFLVLISSLLVTFLGMNWPLVYRHLINQVFYQRDFKKLERVLLVYAALFVAEKILQLIWRLADGVMASNFVYSVKNTLYEKIFSLNMASKENYSTGELLDIMNQDVQQIYTFLMDEGVFAITCLIRLIMAVIYISIINPYASFFILFLVLVNYFLSKYLKKRFLVCFQEYKKKLENYQGFFMDILMGLKEIKLLNAARHGKEAVICRLTELGEWKKKQIFEEAYRQISQEGLHIVSEMALYAAAAYEIANGRMLLGDFVSLMIYYEWAKIFFRVFIQLFTGMSKSFLSLDRINQLMESESETEEGVPAISGDILFDHVSFGYQPGMDVLKEISFSIKHRSITALAGPSGCGKSTIASLLLKLYEPDRGAIWIGNQPLSQVNPKSLRAQIGIVNQNAPLFEATIRKNLLMGKPDADEAELWTALKTAHADQFVSKLPSQLDTSVSQLDNLSTGQRQRILLARVFLKDPDIIILDEATSNIDLETERQFLKDAAAIFREKTVIIIAYRANCLEIADHILYLQSGVVKDRGSHFQLSDQNPEYRNLIFPCA